MSKAYLVGLTTPTATTGCASANELVAYAARVSNPNNQNNTNTAAKLLKYLAKNQHWSPFEMVSLTIGIETTRDISRQILRHRSFSFQEFSQRYAAATKFERREARLQDKKNRQNSIENSDEELETEWRSKQSYIIRLAKEYYQWALESGVAKEQARAILPEGNTKTTLYMAGTLRSWIHYCLLRSDPATQKEHREIAEQCWSIVEQHFPDVVLALTKNFDSYA